MIKKKRKKKKKTNLSKISTNLFLRTTTTTTHKFCCFQTKNLPMRNRGFQKTTTTEEAKKEYLNTLKRIFIKIYRQ